MNRPRPSSFRLLFFITIGSWFLSGCTSPSARLTWAEPAAESFRQDLQGARLRAWQTALEITAAFAAVPAEDCPGIAALVADIQTARARVEAGGTPDLSLLDVDALVTRNPHFWRASLEVAPSDGSILLLHATLLASGGELWRANRILMATTQLLPLEAGTRPLYLMHAYNFGAVIMASVDGLDQRAARAGPARAERVYEDALAVWPRNVLALSGLLELKLRRQIGDESAGERSPGREAAVDAAVATLQPEIRRMVALDPLTASGYRGDPTLREQGRDLIGLWLRLSDSRSALGYKEVGELASALEQGEAHELAMVMQRLLVATRGFSSPSDFMTWRRVLPRLVGAEAAGTLMAAWERGDVRAIALTRLNAAETHWEGDPAINDILRRQVERELAERTFRIGVMRDQPAARAQAYRERGVLHRQAGLFDEALADFSEAMKLMGRQPALLVDQAAVLGTLQRDAEAEAILAELTARVETRGIAAIEFGVLRYGQGRFADARLNFERQATALPAEGYSAIMAELAARRTGSHATSLIELSRRNVIPGSWVDHCLRFLQGEFSAQQLLSRARQGGNLRVAEQLSEAYFILAQTELAQGNTGRGLELLEACIGTGMSGMVEFRLARLELRRLAPDREAWLRQATEQSAPVRPAAPEGEELEPVDESPSWIEFPA